MFNSWIQIICKSVCIQRKCLENCHHFQLRNCSVKVRLHLEFRNKNKGKKTGLPNSEIRAIKQGYKALVNGVLLLFSE